MKTLMIAIGLIGLLAGCGGSGGGGSHKPGDEPDLSIDSRARACDVLLRETADAKVTAVTFGESVTGTFVREAPNVAISFTSNADSAIPSGGVKLAMAGEGEVEISDIACAAADGSALSDPKVALE